MKSYFLNISLSILSICCSPYFLLAESYCHKYVAPNALPSGSGTEAQPWPLNFALSGAGGQITAGSTICLKAGRYPLIGANLGLNGTAEAPITFRNAPNQRAILDANGNAGIILTVTGSHLRLWGLELTDSAVTPQQVNGLWVSGGTDVRIINSYFHNLGSSGINLWSENTGAELYGNYSFFNGRNTTSRGYGIYTQNLSGSKSYEDNFFFWNFGGYNIHAYGQAGQLNNMTFKNNVVMDGIMMVGGTASPAQNLVWEGNYCYRTAPYPTGSIAYLGFSAGVSNAIVKDNIFPSGTVWWAYANDIKNMSGNLFRGTLYYHYNTPTGVAPAHITVPALYPDNTFQLDQTGQGLPAISGTKVFIKKNKYEVGRGNLVIYNFDGLSQISVDLSVLGLSQGQNFEIIDGQNPFGTPIVQGVYVGSPVNIPLNLNSVAVPLNLPPNSASEITEISHSQKEFNFFTVKPITSNVPAPKNFHLTIQ